MAVILGNFNENKKLKEIKENVAHNFKLQTIKRLISELEPQVEIAKDIYDTFCYIKNIDNEFAKKLWKSLCRNNANGIDINSYFSWQVGYGHYALLSRHGVGVCHQDIRDKLMDRFGLSEFDVYHGKAPLDVFVSEFDVKDEILDKIIEDLQVFITSFKKYADDFFSSVSTYSV
jgi:hypothetical protein